MKIFKKSLVLILVIVLVVIAYNYRKLNIIAGFSAKDVSSSVFLAKRSLAFTEAHDTNFSPINLASSKINKKEKSATANVFGLLTRKAVYRKGLGSVLIVDDFDTSKKSLIPHRLEPDNLTPFPYGNAEQKDTIFKNINYAKLSKVINLVFNKKNETRAFVVVYKNHIIAEKYADGFDKNSRILGWSMTKSLLSTVYGIMQFQGKINVLDKAPVAEWQNDERKNITLNNLLQMNSGLEWDEDYNTISDVTKMLFLEKDMSKSQVKKPLVGKPNQMWHYSSGTSNLLSGILRTKMGSYQTYLDYWYTNFIDKIGMNSMVIETDISGNYVASSYAWATPRDWAKFGLLYLHKGNWNGKQLFDSNWVTYATTPTPTSNGEYGAQFWLNAGGKFPNVSKKMFYADGYQGQNVYIFPTKDLVIVRMGLTKNADENKFLQKTVDAIN